jgi:hypothetical protein
MGAKKSKLHKKPPTTNKQNNIDSNKPRDYTFKLLIVGEPGTSQKIFFHAKALFFCLRLLIQMDWKFCSMMILSEFGLRVLVKCAHFFTPKLIGWICSLEVGKTSLLFRFVVCHSLDWTFFYRKKNTFCVLHHSHSSLFVSFYPLVVKNNTFTGDSKGNIGEEYVHWIKIAFFCSFPFFLIWIE